MFDKRFRIPQRCSHAVTEEEACLTLKLINEKIKAQTNESLLVYDTSFLVTCLVVSLNLDKL